MTDPEMESDGFTNARPLKRSWVDSALNVWVTLCLWSYFTLGFVLFFSPLYLWAWLWAKDRQAAFQRLNHRFYKGFFRLLKWLAPAQQWRIAEEVRDIRSSIIVSNHLSYLDPLIFMSLYDRHSTIAKARLFRIPVFGQMLSLSGYIPSHGEGSLAERMMKGMEQLPSLFASGGNFFVFPEGTRSASGGLTEFSKGAFKIARRLKVPIHMVFIRHTDLMFKPGRFLFNARNPETLSLDLAGTIHPDDEAAQGTLQLAAAAARMLSEAMERK